MKVKLVKQTLKPGKMAAVFPKASDSDA